MLPISNIEFECSNLDALIGNTADDQSTWLNGLAKCFYSFAAIYAQIRADPGILVAV